MIDALERLANLWKAGALTDEEFAEQKARLFAAQAAAMPAPLDGVPVAEFSPEGSAPEVPFEDVSARSYDELLFDDLNALPDGVLAEPSQSGLPVTSEDSTPVVEETVSEIVLPDDGALSFDDLNAMLDAELADMAFADAQPVLEEISEVTESVEIEDTSLPTEDDLLFDDLNALLAAEASDARPAGLPDPDVVPDTLAADDTLSVDDLNAMLDVELSNFSATDASPEIEATPTPAGAALAEEALQPADGDQLFDDLNALLEDIEETVMGDPADLAQEGSPGTDPPLAADPALYDLDALLEGVALDTLPPEDTKQANEIAPAVEALADDAELAPTAPTTPEAAVTDVGRKMALTKVITRVLRGLVLRFRRLQRRLPKPVLLSLGGLALFAISMGAGVALALVTQGEAHPEGQAQADASPSTEGASDAE